MVAQRISDDDKQIARVAVAVFGGSPKVVEYLDQNETTAIGVLSCPDRPTPGLTSYCTVGLSDHPVPRDIQPPLGSEIVAVSNLEKFAAIVATAAFCVINGGWMVEPGRIFPGVVTAHVSDTTVPNLMFVDPYLWDGFHTRTLSDKTVAWLMGVPVSDAELAYLRENGSDALEQLFERTDPDFVDLRRASVV